MKKRKIKVAAVLEDIRSGMRDDALMLKYELSPRQLQGLLRRLEEGGLLTREDYATDFTISGKSPDGAFRCPSCGKPLSGTSDVCPHCGIVVSKYVGAEDPAKREPSAMSRDTFGPGGLELVTAAPPRTRASAFVVIILVALAGFWAYRWIGQGITQQSLVNNLRPTLNFIVENKSQDPDWGQLANSILEVTRVSSNPLLPSDSQMEKELDGIHATLVEMAALQIKVKNMMPKLRREVAQKLDPDVMDRIAIDLEARVAEVQRENVPEIIRKHWERFQDSMKAGNVQGLQITYGQLKDQVFLAQVRTPFEGELRKRMEQSLEKARQLIGSRESFRSWPKGAETYDFKISTPAGNLTAKGKYNLSALIFDESEFGEEWSAAIDKLLASAEHEDLESYRVIEAEQDKIDDGKRELRIRCREVLRMIKEQP